MKNKILFLFFFLFFFSSCEKDIQLDFPPGEDVLVVEGYIENGQLPYVILTKGLPFFGNITGDEYKKYFVSGAKVTLYDGTRTINLTELSRDGYTIYAAILKGDTGAVGKTYDLKIDYDNHEYTSSTTILPPVALDSVWLLSAPKGVDTNLVQLYCRFTEPGTPGNYYRALTKRNKDVFFDTAFGSVFDDKVVNGKTFNFNILRGKSDFQNNDTAKFETYGYFNKGDTIYIKWASIERVQYDFWRTYESQGNSFGNPFSSTVIIKSNMKGKNVTGVWASYGAFLDTIIAR